MITIDTQEFYDIEELANLLHIGEQGARRLLRLGKMKGQKVSRKWYVSKDEVKRYLTAGQEQGQDAGNHVNRDTQGINGKLE